MSGPTTTGFGFLGAGSIARTALAPAVHAAQGAHLQAAAARDADRAAGLEPRGRAYDDYAALLGDEAVEVVYVALSNEAHEEWTLRALEAGKHVLCEKPLGLGVEQVRRMTAAAAAADRLLVEALWYRWHPRTVRAVELISSGALGRVGRVESEFSFDGDFSGEAASNYRMRRDLGGGAVLDVGCYAVDAARWALQAGALEVVSAQGVLDPGPAAGVDLRAVAVLRAEDGATAEVRCGIVGHDEQLVAVYGEEATLVLGSPAFMARDETVRLHLHPQDGASSAEVFAPVDPYRLMVEGVAAAARGEDVWLPDAAGSLDVAAVLETVLARVHGEPDPVPPVPAAPVPG